MAKAPLGALKGIEELAGQFPSATSPKQREAVKEPVAVPDPASEGRPKAANTKRERKPDVRETPRFSIRLEQELLDEIEGVLDSAKAVMRIPKHIRLTKSDFIEWCIRDGLEKVKKSSKQATRSSP
ncbi:MAG: hypothetical protein HQL38_08620 [Alphaproteobacteria bacterium]|nr:hypothetical protein [Alphaproteobacteria bacterium]